MSGAVTIVIPALGDVGLLETALRGLESALAHRRGTTQILVVDDSGENLLTAWLAERFPGVHCVVNATNQGFARALSAGVDRARSEFVFAMNSDVRVRAGFLEPLEAALRDKDVFAAVPRILLHGREAAIESIVSVRLENGIARAVQPAVETEGALLQAREAALGPVPFPIGGAFLFRRADFLRLGGFDRAFEPFYLEDMDLGWRAWKSGQSCRYVASSVVEHHHRGTIGALVPEPVVRTAIERNRLLFTWKHLDEAQLQDQHVRALARRVAVAAVLDDRTFLAALCLALEDRGAAAAESAASRGAPTWSRIQQASDPLRIDRTDFEAPRSEPD